MKTEHTNELDNGKRPPSPLERRFRQYLDKHVANVILRLNERLPGKKADYLIPCLEKRISEAQDKGLASAVYWHGKWFCYAHAVYMLETLKKPEA